MADCQTLEKIFPWMQAVISHRKVVLAMDSTKKPHLTSNRLMEKISTYDI